VLVELNVSHSSHQPDALMHSGPVPSTISFAAGSLTTIAAAIALQPLDTVRTRFVSLSGSEHPSSF